MAVLLAIPAAAQGPVDTLTASTRQLEHVAIPAPNGSHLPRLVALRQLRDPELAEFFEALLTTETDPVRVHAILGLAELASPPRLNPALVPLVDERAQQIVIATAIDKGMIDRATRDVLLADESLAAMPHALLAGEALLQGQAPDPKPLRLIASQGDTVAADLAALLLAQMGEPLAFETSQSRVAAMPDELRASSTIWILDAARQYEITAVLDWVAELAHQDVERPIDADVRNTAIFALLALDIPAGVEAWEAVMPRAERYRDRVRAALVLLATEGLGPEPFRAIEGDEPIVAALRDAGIAMTTGENIPESLETVFDLDHAASAEWAMEILADQPDDVAIPVLEYLIDRGALTGPRRAARATRATVAVARLHGRAPEMTLRRLAEAEDDSPQQEILVLGLYDVHDPDVGRVLAGLRRIGEGRVDSLALLLEARYAEVTGTFDPVKGAQLSRLATGGSSLSPPLQTQAAWLVLRHRGRTADAIEAVRR